jgi:large subunit ribosomal protein L5
MARLKDAYNEQVKQRLIDKFGYSSAMQAPKVTKITVNMGVGEAKQDAKMLEAARSSSPRSRGSSRTCAARASPSPRSSCARACQSGSR